MHSEVIRFGTEIAVPRFKTSRISEDDPVRSLEEQVRIVGVDHAEATIASVHTIDIWYSLRRKAWIVERLDADGSQLGAAYRCASEEDAAACLEEWLRAHDSTQLCAPHEMTAAEKRVLAHVPSRSRAA